VLPPDPALGVFETVLVLDGRVQAFERHRQRLSDAVRELYGHDLRMPSLSSRIASLTGPNRLRITAVPGSDGLAVSFDLAPLDPTALRLPVALHPVPLPAGLGTYKWRDRSWLDAQKQVALLVDADGCVLEGAWGNVWALEGSRLVTPPADGRILAGVTRGLLLELGLEAGVEPLTLERLGAANAVFLTSALRHAVAAGLGEAPPRAPDAVEQIRASLAVAAWGTP
jgi:branched-subunit amino acid aminotransferase/4-amino-4-deoxychorismate lyase